MSGTRALRWFKSSYSDSGGGNCVEVAYDWRKSSYSDGGGGNCVEIAACPHTIHIRDSKNPGGGIVTVSDAAWCTFLASPHPSPKKCDTFGETDTLFQDTYLPPRQAAHMNSSQRVQEPPGMATVYRATLDALAARGPRRTGITHIAQLAGTNRPFFYRNWASPDALLRDATMQELKRLLHLAREVPGPLPPPRCLGVRRVVRAARLLREHPVVAAMARTEPALTYAAVLRPDTLWHRTAQHWLTEHVTAHLPSGTEQDTATLAVLTTAMPYALIPPEESPDTAAERAAVDGRLSQALHACLGLPLTCPD